MLCCRETYKRKRELDTSKDLFSSGSGEDDNSSEGVAVKEVGFNFQRILTPKK